MLKQRSIKKSVSLIGVGVHSGKAVEIRLHPAEDNTGIIFRRIDLSPPVNIPAITAFISDTRMNTSLSASGATVATIEHLMSAFAGFGIDNVYVDSESELPIMDGSANNFVALIESAGIKEQQAAKQFLRIKDSIEVRDGDKFARLEPYEGFKFSMSIHFDHPVIQNSPQSYSFDLTCHKYIAEISQARTFGFLSEYEFCKKNNLALGASLDNTIVLDDKHVVNQEGLRYQDEFVKHKLLDAIGDMHLLGYNIIGAFSGHKSGHQLNHQLRQAVLANEGNWELTTLSTEDKLAQAFQWN